jgi:hypothetical protein
MDVKVLSQPAAHRGPEEIEEGNFLWIRAEAAIGFEQGDGSRIVQEISSPGLYQIDGGSDESYLVSVEADEVEVLTEMLEALGLEVEKIETHNGFPVEDSAALDNLAKYLNEQDSWSGADACEVFAEALMATGREIDTGGTPPVEAGGMGTSDGLGA